MLLNFYSLNLFFIIELGLEALPDINLLAFKPQNFIVVIPTVGLQPNISFNEIDATLGDSIESRMFLCGIGIRLALKKTPESQLSVGVAFVLHHTVVVE